MNEAKELAPVKTGTLRRSIHIETTKTSTRAIVEQSQLHDSGQAQAIGPSPPSSFQHPCCGDAAIPRTKNCGSVNPEINDLQAVSGERFMKTNVSSSGVV